MVIQEEWVDYKVKTLGQGPHWMTILSAPPNPMASVSTPLLIPAAFPAAPLHAALPSNDIPLLCVLKLALVCLFTDALTPSPSPPHPHPFVWTI